MKLEVSISYNNSVLQDLLQICKLIGDIIMCVLANWYIHLTY